MLYEGLTRTQYTFIMEVNFITLKWGKKYGPEYVNRLYNTLLNIYTGSFKFCCYTDDPTGIDSQIIIKDIAELRTEETNCFTIEKMFLFDGRLKGNNVILDLDILIQKNFYPYFEQYQFTEGRFLKNGDWCDVEYSELAARTGTCYINSSFVTWKDDQLKCVLDFYKEHKDIIEFKYEDLDTFLFQALRKNLHYHPYSAAMSYNYNSYREDIKDYLILLFNTSHGKHTGVELHSAADWVIDLWKKYD